jgi:large subunit ribosomal protein L17
MRHRKSGRQLGRNSSHRKAMYRNMATSLLEHGQIRTTDAKAKELRKVVEKLITLSKRITPTAIAEASEAEAVQLRAERVHAVRQARKTVKDRGVLQVLFGEYSERYQDRPGGYTRITKIGRRNGDNAPMSLIELVEEACEPKGSAPKAPLGEDDFADFEGSEDAEQADADDLDSDEDEVDDTLSGGDE